VHGGESVALIRRNGAGKSTLLSLIAGLSLPDSGHIDVEGRLAALLNLGAGFHPDLTGRENLFVNAALFGLKRKEVYERYDRIVGFAGLGDFIGQPLRTYSPGMIVRLAFSVAVQVDPEIVLIDEVLAVETPISRKSVREKSSASSTLVACLSASRMELRSCLRLCKRALCSNTARSFGTET
jgi:ABC-type polysaccharide/polyol phosphate transport system ATPase subunit